MAIAALSFYGGLWTGQAEIVAVAIPFVVAVVMGVTPPPPEIGVAVAVSSERCIEGDRLEIAITLTCEGTLSDVQVGMGLPAGMRALDGPARDTILIDNETTVCFEVIAERWGARWVGPVALKVHAPGRLISFERILQQRILVKVFPEYERLRRTLPPPHTQMYTGDYVSRHSGDGIEFANVRPFSSGDSIRKVNWRVTSRRGELHVNLAHPERDADIVLFLDTFSDVDLGNKSTLDLTVAGAAAIVERHLRHNDRIGLVSFGGTLRWLTASMGRTHAYRIADFLLDVNATFSYAWKHIEGLPRKTLPPEALVVAFSPLIDKRALRALQGIGAAGFSLIVIDVLNDNSIAPGPKPEDRVAHRVWKLQRSATRTRFRSAGIPVIPWSGRAGIEAALARAPRRAKRFEGPVRT